MAYLLAIMVTAVRFGRGPSIVAAGLSVAAFDFFFIPPLFSFAVTDFKHVFTFAMMFAVGLVVSTLTEQLRREETRAKDREARTGVLYALSRELSSAQDEAEAARVLATHAAALFGTGAGVVLAREPSALAASAGSLAFETAEREETAKVLSLASGAGVSTARYGTSRTTCVPLRSGERTLGVLALSPRSPPADTEARELLETFVRQGALALERARLAEDAKAAALKVRTEQMRNSLLSAVSHDLRTPLAAITGAATTLREGGTRLSEADRTELYDAISEESARLERQVGNLLEMTRLESGAVQPKREWVLLEEVAGSALDRLDAKLGARPVKVEMASDLVFADPVLLEQVFINLLDNAAKYTPVSAAISISARFTGALVEVEVSDRGPGLPPAELTQVFEKFFRGQHPEVPGVGLGLAICKAIVEIHGGTLRVQNLDGGGARFTFTLPQPADRPVLR
jgi:two-component system sensor histidine kinase KdpD